jgi:Cu(I)/Ag(I) efflux system membrane fusion protein
MEDGTLKFSLTNCGCNAWTNRLGVMLVGLALVSWGCAKSDKLAAGDDHEHCTCHDDDCHDHPHDVASDETIKANLAKLSDEDRKAAEAQRFCAIKTDRVLGSTGVPRKLSIEGRTVFFCCDECIATAMKDPKSTLATLDALLQHSTAHLPTSSK